MKRNTTERGFGIVEFVDHYGYKCSLQKSSLATEDCIWLGLSKVEPKVLKQGAGWRPYPLPEGVHIASRMHLTQEHVREMLPFLQHFAETGELGNGLAIRGKEHDPPATED